MGRKGVRSVDPSPAQIAALTAEIRRNWDTKESCRRQGTEPYRVPVLAFKSLSIERPIVRIH